jgi:5'-methylthioadenosine phosphorylase
MTNLGEAKCAREAEIAYATLAMVTDYDGWKVDEEHVTWTWSSITFRKNATLAKSIISHLIPRIPRQPDWSCHSALKCAIMTDPKFWPAKTRKDLAPLLARYF